MTPLAEVPTPCLVVDAAAVDHNLREAARQAAGLAIRPHFKAHKCVPLLQRQLAAPGHRGATCATAEEALVLARAGVDDVLVANEVVDPAGIGELREAARHARITVAVDSAVGLDLLAGLGAGVLVDIDVGQGRCGLAPGDPLVVELARAAGARFTGLMGYDGHAQHAPPAARERSTAHTAAVLAAERERLEAAGIPVAVVSGAGSGTLAAAARHGVLTEAQAGSYALLDVEYGDLGLGFRNAVRCLATVVSRRGDTAVLNAGLKQLSCEHGLPRAEREDAEVVGAADEHLTLRLALGCSLAVGDRVAVTPHHLDPTMALHDAIVMSDGDRAELWPVAGRSSVSERWRRRGPGQSSGTWPT